MNHRLRYAVVTTNGRDCVQECLDAIGPQVNRIILVTHRCNPSFSIGSGATTLISYDEHPPNISRMWNLGLSEAERLAWKEHMSYDVAVLNDDAIVPEHWFTTIVSAMRSQRCIAGSMDQYRMLAHPQVFREPVGISLRLRMSGFAFVLDGTFGLRLDEQFRWWYGDDDLEWRARQEGGVVRVPGEPVEHLYPGGTTHGILSRIAGDDRRRFKKKWGRTPH